MPNQPRTRREEGFTLIEIVLVLVLIGAIVAFAASRIMGGGDRAKVNLAKAQMHTMLDKVDQYRTDVGALPSTLQDLVEQPSSAKGWLGPYAKAGDLADPWGQPLRYNVSAGKPRITSLGRDGKEGGTSVDSDLVVDMP